MSKRRKRKPSVLRHKFTVGMQKKLVMLFIAILLAFVILVGRITYINASSGEDYTKTVLDQQQYMSQSIPFKRGDIVDTNGTKLATSERVYNVILDAKVLLSDETKKAENIAATKKALKSYFQIKASAVDAIIADSPDSRYNILKKGISYDDAKAFEAAEKKNSKIKGIWLEEDYVRKYPYNTLACDVLGFSVSGNVGASGLEASYNSTLNGTDGRRYGYQNEDSAIENTVKEPINGNTIVTTIDANLQSIVEKHLEEFNQAHTDEAQEGMGFKNGAVIMMNPNTGEVLAMASSPTYDLNNPRDLSKYYTEEEITGMSSDDKIDALNELWRNFCVSDSYEPGSPQKAFTVAGAIEEGAISGNEVFECGGKLHFGDWDIRCVARAGHGPLTITQGLMKSCNVVMMRIVSLEGKEKFVQYQKIFGFGEKTGIDLPGEASGLIYQASNMDPASLATNAFGQNYNCTMVQMAAGYASLINGGSYYEPHVVKEILNDEGSVVKSVSPNLVRETVSESTSNFINNALYQTVSGDGGTAGAAAVAGYEVAGKTGTAQKQPRAEKNYLVSFIGYAPAYNPQVLCYVVVDTPHLPGEQQAHSTFASEIFSKIMAEVLPYKNVFPAGGAAQDLETNLSSQEEGIISGTATEDPNAAETPAETTPAPEGGWANYDEEFIDSGDEYSYPDTMGNVQDESAAVGNGETAGTGRDTGTADNAGETAASQEAQAAGD